jgi:hypothetical protein
MTTLTIEVAGNYENKARRKYFFKHDDEFER